MKQWFAIFALLWVTAAAQTAGDRHPTPCIPEIHATTIAPESGNDIRTNDTPLLATATLPGGTQLSTPVSDAGKGGRSSESLHTPAARILSDALYAPHKTTVYNATYGSNPANTRNAARYIYFLRRIII